MTDLVAFNPAPSGAVSITDYQTRAVQRLTDWVQSADAAFAVAERLVRSSFVPAVFQGKPIEATAAILAGSEVGLSPMAALRAFDVIQGQAAARAITLRAIVQSHGHEVVLRESTATRAIVEARRRGSSEWQRSVWTIDRARELQLVGKDNWKKQPGAMLVARATAEVCRLVASDAILGIGYTIEELADGASGEPSAWVEPAPEASRPKTRVMARPSVDDVEEATAVAVEEWSAADEQDAPTLLTKAQSRALHAAFSEAGMSDRAQRLAYCSQLIGRELQSSADLTTAEASRVLDALREDVVATWETATGGQP